MSSVKTNLNNVKNTTQISANKFLRIWCILGFIVSLYATYVEIKIIFDKDYKALCDISNKISCTTVFSSTYGKSFGFLNSILPDTDASSIWNPPNGLFGIVYYGALYATTFFHHPALPMLQLIFSIISNIMSVYLAYLLYVLDNLCVVCLLIYIINLLCLWEIIRKNKTFCSHWFSSTKRSVNKTD